MEKDFFNWSLVVSTYMSIEMWEYMQPYIDICSVQVQNEADLWTVKILKSERCVAFWY